MIGFDRPLRPEWIYTILKRVKPGDNPERYYRQFEEIVKELIGKEGKRKVRTVVFRSFIYSMQEGTSVIKDNLFLKWAKQHSLNELKPILLIKLLMDYDICRFILKKISISIRKGNELSIPLLAKKVIQKYGDRDVVRRSLRSFLKTLAYFGFVHGIESESVRLELHTTLTETQIHYFLILYGDYFLKSKSIDLNSIHTELLYLFERPRIADIARKHHGQDWEYIRDAGRNILYLK
ncbi:MAG: hypothetical protein JXB88_00630 [Spirochaetales bacterium]|nr:hypothetical protein [Spirochaetales bacterium]